MTNGFNNLQFSGIRGLRKIGALLESNRASQYALYLAGKYQSVYGIDPY